MPATDRSSASDRSSPNPPPPSSTSADSFALSGPSALPDPRTNAYRGDLADVALKDCVIASHYAEPLDRRLVDAAALRLSPDDAAETLADLPAGDRFAMLDNSLGWAWGYAGDDRLVGYVRSSALGL